MQRIDIRPNDDILILDLKGKLYAGGSDERLRDKVNSLVHQGFRKILVNMEYVTHVDTAGFGALISAQQTVQEARGQFALINPMARLQSMLVISGLITHFRLFDDEAAAIAAMQSAPRPAVGESEPSRQASTVAPL